METRLVGVGFKGNSHKRLRKLQELCETLMEEHEDTMMGVMGKVADASEYDAALQEEICEKRAELCW